MNLPDNTTDRLLAVADIIEFTPEKWNQGVYYYGKAAYDNDDNRSPDHVAGREPGCGTTACMAGWGVILNPQWQRLTGLSWERAGQISLGLRRSLSYVLFDGGVEGDPADVADLLRHIAKLPESERTLEQVEMILPPRLLAVLQTSDVHPLRAYEDDED